MIQPDVAAIYVPTAARPTRASFPFDRLGYRGFVILRESEARKLLDDMDPKESAGSSITTLRARALARALVAQTPLEVLQGLVVARGRPGIDGCVSSAKVLVPVPFDDEEEELPDEDSNEERYEFDIPKPIIEKGEVEPRGAYGTFVGRFISTYQVSVGLSVLLRNGQARLSSMHQVYLQLTCIRRISSASSSRSLAL